MVGGQEHRVAGCGSLTNNVEQLGDIARSPSVVINREPDGADIGWSGIFMSPSAIERPIPPKTK